MNGRRYNVLIDASRNNVPTVETVKDYLRLFKDMGYNSFSLYTEDMFELEKYPHFGYMRGRYSKAEVKEMVAYATELGMEWIPSFQGLAHLQNMFRWDDLKAFRDNTYILLAEDERTYAFIEEEIKFWRECCPDATYCKIGMDEASMLGLGTYLKKHGYTKPSEILRRHMKRVNEIVIKYGFHAVYSGDSFFRAFNDGAYYVTDPDVIPDDAGQAVPEGAALTYWDYFPLPGQFQTMMKAYAKFKCPVFFCASVNSWTGFTPHTGNALHWLPNSLPYCDESVFDSVVISQWGDDGGECSVYASLPAFFYCIETLKGDRSLDSIKAKFKAKYGIAFDDFAYMEQPVNYLDTHNNYNSEKPVLFNDPFCGVYDDIVPKDMREFDARYLTIRDKLASLKDAPKYGYLFDACAALTEAIRLKMDLGVRTRAVYTAADRGAVDALLERYAAASSAIRLFYEKLRYVWYKERKGNGFEVQCVRYGGILTRLEDCAARLADWRDGRIDRISELEEPIQSINTPAENFKDNSYGKCVTTNTLTNYNVWGNDF